MAVLGVTAASGAAVAQDLNYVVGFGASVEYEDNPGRRTTNEESSVIYGFTPRLEGTYEDERDRLDFLFELNFEESNNENVSPNRQEGEIDLEGVRAFERGTLAAAANLSSQAFQRSRFDDDELLSDADSISVTEDQTVNSAQIDLNARYDIDEIRTGYAGVAYEITDFSGGNSENFHDTEVFGGLDWSVSEWLTVGPSLSASRFVPEDSPTIDNLSALMNLQYTLSETDGLTLAFGYSFSDTANGYLIDAEYFRTFEFFRLTLAASRQLEPNNVGALDEEERASAGIVYDLSDLSTLGTSVNWVDNGRTEAKSLSVNYVYEWSEFTSLGVNANARESKRAGGTNEELTVTPFVNWVVTEDLGARLSYRELRQYRDNQPNVRSGLVAFSINYEFPQQ